MGRHNGEATSRGMASMNSLSATTRSHFLWQRGMTGVALISRSAVAASTIDLPFPIKPRSRFTAEIPQKRAMSLQRTRQPGTSMKLILILLPCLLVTKSPCFAQETSVSTAIDKSISKTLSSLHLQLDRQYSKLRKSSSERFKLECAAGDCVRTCTGGQTCSCSTSGTSCSCSACQ